MSINMHMEGADAQNQKSNTCMLTHEYTKHGRQHTDTRHKPAAAALPAMPSPPTPVSCHSEVTNNESQLSVRAWACSHLADALLMHQKIRSCESLPGEWVRAGDQ